MPRTTVTGNDPGFLHTSIHTYDVMYQPTQNNQPTNYMIGLELDTRTVVAGFLSKLGHKLHSLFHFTN